MSTYSSRDAAHFLMSFYGSEAVALRDGELLEVDWTDVYTFDPNMADFADRKPDAFADLLRDGLADLPIDADAESVSVVVSNWPDGDGRLVTDGGACSGQPHQRCTVEQWEKKAELSAMNGDIGNAMKYAHYANIREQETEGTRSTGGSDR